MFEIRAPLFRMTSASAPPWHFPDQFSFFHYPAQVVVDQLTTFSSFFPQHAVNQ
jgi:hypothetical protein